MRKKIETEIQAACLTYMLTQGANKSVQVIAKSFCCATIVFGERFFKLFDGVSDPCAVCWKAIGIAFAHKRKYELLKSVQVGAQLIA